jgi:DNA-directed RNA polymerase specialized sigma24 family protein
MSVNGLTLAQWIGGQLPYLRRYARALVGGQEAGDVHVTVTLERILNDPATFDQTLSRRAALYRVFCDVYRAAPPLPKVATAPEGAEGEVASRLGTLAVMPREAFLLVAMEEFSVEDTAKILRTSVEEVRGLLSTAGSEIASQIATEVLIIEDEPLISMDLAELVESLGHKVVGIARTRTEAGRLAAQVNPGLVLADIQLADGSSGIAAVNDMLQTLSVPVIFITAYPERLLTGERPEPTFLVSKPYGPDMLKAMISQAMFFSAKASPPVRVS